MKKFWKEISLAVLFIFSAIILNAIGSRRLISETGLAYTSRYTIDTNAEGINRLSAQAVYSSATFFPQTFNDGLISSATIVISSNTALSSATATNTILIASNTALTGAYASNTISISSNAALISSTNTIFLTFNGSTLTANKEWLPNALSSITAVNISSAINTLRVYGVTASTTGTGSTITITASNVGTAWNRFTLSASTIALIIGSTTSFTGGKDPAVLTFNTYKFIANRDYNVDTTFSTNTAKNIANMLNFSTYSITATTTTINFSTGNAILLTATQYGTYPNSFGLSSSTAAFTISASSFTGGRDAAFIKINGVKLTNGIDWFSQTFASYTAQSLSNAISTHPILSQVVISTWNPFSVVITSSLFINHNDYSVFTSTQLALPISSVAYASNGSASGYFQNGYDTDISTTTNFISSANVLTPGLGVLYTRNTGTSPGLLVNQTTYYISSPDSQKFKLARTSTGAVTGTTISISTQNTAGGGFFTLTPIPLSGTSTMKWQISNDSATWIDLSVPSISITSNTLQNSTTYWDLGTVNAQYYSVLIGTPTTGASVIRMDINGKQ